MKKALLVFPDNTVFRGTGIGAIGAYAGELVFNTSMQGYVESLTDPSYAGQILTFTYPLIGNYGVSPSWFESKKTYPSAIIASEISNTSIHFESKKSVEAWMSENKMGGMIGVDTREITKKIRENGTLFVVLSVYESTQIEFVSKVSCKKPIIINPQGQKTVILVDYGKKQGQVEQLRSRNIKVVIVPSTYKIADMLPYQPDGFVLSNGPGDPQELTDAVMTIQQILHTQLPVFGICLGHQLLCLALGGKTYKLPYGHRGSNQPVLNTITRRAYISSHNHGFAVDAQSLPKNVQVTYVNLNDNSVEGVKHVTKPWFSVQFHPEANPGPKDTEFLFDEFLQLL